MDNHLALQTWRWTAFPDKHGGASLNRCGDASSTYFAVCCHVSCHHERKPLPYCYVNAALLPCLSYALPCLYHRFASRHTASPGGRQFGRRRTASVWAGRALFLLSGGTTTRDGRVVANRFKLNGFIKLRLPTRLSYTRWRGRPRQDLWLGYAAALPTPPSPYHKTTHWLSIPNNFCIRHGPRCWT